MWNSHDRRSAAHGRKNKSGNRRVYWAEARKSTKPQGRRPIRRAGVTGDVKVPDTYRSYRTYGQDSNNASKAGTDNAQAWPRLKSRKWLSLKPGIILKVLPREEDCSLKPVPEKTERDASQMLWTTKGHFYMVLPICESAKQTPATIINYGCWLRNGELSDRIVPHCFFMTIWDKLNQDQN